MTNPETVPITDDEIRLGQFLKLSGLADSGADARELISEGEVRVNGEIDTRRGRRLVVGDLVEVSQPQGFTGVIVGGADPDSLA